MTNHNVHLYCVVRVRVPDVEADTQIEAIEKAVEENENTLHTMFGGRYLGLDFAYAEEIAQALVDRVGDAEFLETNTYETGDSGWVQTCSMPPKGEAE